MKRIVILLTVFACASARGKQSKPDSNPLVSSANALDAEEDQTGPSKTLGALPYAANTAFQPIVEALSQHPEWRNVTLQEIDSGDCPNLEDRGWFTVSKRTDDSVICLHDGDGEPRCLAHVAAAQQQREMCNAKSLSSLVPPPPAAKELQRAAKDAGPDAGIFVRSVGGEGVDALWVGSTTGMGHHLAIFSESELNWTDLPLLSELALYGHVEVTDTSQATHMPSFGIVAQGYDGGSGQGEERTELRIVTPNKGRLLEVGAFRTGYLFWRWNAREKRKVLRKLGEAYAPGNRARPHVEIAMRMKVNDGSLELERTTPPLPASLQKRFACDEGASEFDCPLPTIEAIAAFQGTWQWTGQGFARAP